MSGAARSIDTWPSPSSVWRFRPTTPLVVVAVPADPRVAFLREAMRSAGLARPLLVPYQDTIARPGVLNAEVPSGALLRIDSPGRDREVQRGILNRGYSVALDEGRMSTPPSDVARLSSVKGLIVNARQWYLGFCAVLEDIEAAVDRLEAVRFTSAPDDIRVMFDKSTCHARLRAAGLPVPESLGSPECWEDMLREMRNARCSRVFAKLRHGSAASGVVALEISRDRVQAWTTVETEYAGGSLQLFNSRRIRCLHRENEIAELIDALCKQGLHVERWVPKAGVSGRRFGTEKRTEKHTEKVSGRIYRCQTNHPDMFSG